MKAMEMRGTAFQRRRIARGLSADKVAKILRLPRHNVVAYEAGIIMQLPQDAETRFSSLNSKWTAEDLRNFNRENVRYA